MTFELPGLMWDLFFAEVSGDGDILHTDATLMLKYLSLC